MLFKLILLWFYLLILPFRKVKSWLHHCTSTYTYNNEYSNNKEINHIMHKKRKTKGYFDILTRLVLKHRQGTCKLLLENINYKNIMILSYYFLIKN